MDALPTPFDIAPVPAVPFTPSLLLWILVLGGLLALTTIVVLLARNAPRKPAALRATTIQRLRQLSSTIQQGDFKQLSLEGVLLLRRYLAGQYTLDIDALSGTELKHQAENLPEATSRKLILLLVDFELVRFAPHADRERIKTLLEETISVLTEGDVP